MFQASELMRYRCHEMFSCPAGVEVREAVKSGEQRGQVTVQRWVERPEKKTSANVTP